MSKYSNGYMEDEYLKKLLLNELSYDPSTGNIFWSVKKPRRNMDKPVGTKHSSGYLIFSTGVNSKVYSLRVHRVVWLLLHGDWPEHFVDHINRDRTDNRAENLRAASNTENARNSSIPSTNKSGYKGVSWSEYHNRWVARIGVGNKVHKFLGYYKCPTVAAIAYDNASKEYHGDFGGRNFD